MEKDLLYRYIGGETSAQEEKAVADWVRADPAHQKELNTLWFVRNAAAVHAPQYRSNPVPHTGWRWHRTQLARRCMQAAAALMLIAGSWHLSRQITIEDSARQYLSISAPAGQRIDITLQDGSNVCLNSGARLEYPIRFGKTRRVKLTGEAMFDVNHDAAHPFIVETFACDIEVLGTKFNVAADERANLFATALLRGKLRVTGKLGRNERIVMNTNDLVRLNRDRLTLETICNTDDYLWPEGVLNLAGHRFTEIIDRLTALYGVRITIEKTTIPQLDIIRGKIPVSMGLDYALRALQKITPFEYTQENDQSITIR